MDKLNINYMNETINNPCYNFEVLFLQCMKNPNPMHNKCKSEFDLWYNCFIKTY